MRFYINNNFLISTVIPTYGRPDFLNRSINSALKCQGDSVEVIVVPNGTDNSWEKVSLLWEGDERVKFLPIKKAHACIARNYGLSMSTGKYVRFLDDDDYLLPGAAIQVRLLEQTNKSICIGNVELRNKYGNVVGKRTALETTDFFDLLMLNENCAVNPFAYLYRRKDITDCHWQENCSVGQDAQWLYDLLKRKNYEIIVSSEVVGIWYQHDGTRIANRIDVKTRSKAACLRLFDLKYFYSNDVYKNDIICNKILNLSFRYFYSDVKYWSMIIDKIVNCNSRAIINNNLTKKFPIMIKISPKILSILFSPIFYFRRILK